MNKKTALVYIYGLGCNHSLNTELIINQEVLHKIESVLEQLGLDKQRVFKIRDKTYTLEDIKSLQNKVSKLDKKNITFMIFSLLLNKLAVESLNDIYLLNMVMQNIYNVNGLEKMHLKTVHVLCDSSTQNQVNNIGTYFCNPTKYSQLKRSMYIEDNKYYEESLNYILTYLKDPAYSNVIVIGHSYGGSITSKIAKFLNTMRLSKIELNKLQMATLGSIYIPPVEKTKNIKIHHYVYKNDMAFTQCSRITNYSLYPNLHVMKSTRASFKENENIFNTIFNKGNINAHNNYNNIVSSIIKNNNTNIDIDKL